MYADILGPLIKPLLLFSDFYTEQNFWIIVGSLCGVISIQFLVILCCFRRRKDYEDKSYSLNNGKQNPAFS